MDTSSKVEEIKKLYENGVPVKLITRSRVYEKDQNSGLAYGDFPIKAFHREISKLPRISI